MIFLKVARGLTPLLTRFCILAEQSSFFLPKYVEGQNLRKGLNALKFELLGFGKGWMFRIL